MQNNLTYWLRDLDPQRYSADLSWNFPEQRSHTLKIIGGNSQTFATEVKIAEFIDQKYPFIREVRNVFPDALRPKFPSGLPTLDYYDSTDSGSFKPSADFRNALDGADYALLLGDFSKNSETAIAVTDLIKNVPDTPLLLTRDTIDLLAPEAATFIERPHLTIVASLVQLQKLFRALYYPKMLLLSSPLLPIIETLHKFTLSYPVALLTFHEGKIIVAQNGTVYTVDISKTAYSPISLWSGEVAAQATVFQMFNPHQSAESLLASLSAK